MPAEDTPVAVIGGGVSGATCATVLQLLGFPTVLHVLEEPDLTIGRRRRPGFATEHAAASVIPHITPSARVTGWTATSLEFFRLLALTARAGVRRQRHYEVFEDPVAPPPYAGLMDGFTALPPGATPDGVPRRPGAPAVSGWAYESYFCEPAAYLPFLYDTFRGLGGRVLRIDRRRARLADHLAFGHRILVNCTGEGATRLLADDDAVRDVPDPPRFVPLRDSAVTRYLRGHYLLVDVPRYRGEPVSYNYTPSADVYADPAGAAAGVYCYPRSDAWLLGGSRHRHDGLLDEDAGTWPGDDLADDRYTTFPHPAGGSIRVPAAVLELNAALVRGMTGGRVDLAELHRTTPEAFVPGVGLRFQRAPAHDAVRLDVSRVRFRGEQFVVHDYGHGGAGYTLSWGCALSAARAVASLRPPSPQPRPPGNRTTHHLTTLTQALTSPTHP